MLLFHREPALRRTAAEVARALYLPEAAVADLLRALCGAGILACDEACYWYAPSEPLARALDSLDKAYRDNLVGVTHLIHNSTQKSAMRFSEAFKWRKDN